MVASFRRIARATKHDMTEEDLQQNAWIIAQEIGGRRGREIDFSDPSDQDLIIRAVHVQNVKRGDWYMRNAIHIDEKSDDEEDIPSWSERLAAPVSSDPLIAMLLHESAEKVETILANSFSEAVAYLCFFPKFKNNRQDICSYLAIAAGTLNRRMNQAACIFKQQPSLFDQIEKIDSDFMPKSGKRYVVKAKQILSDEQWAWEF